MTLDRLLVLEPAQQHQSFATQLGVRMAVFLGSYPFASPHTRPPRLSTSSPSAEVIDPLPFLRNSVDVPAGR